MNPDTLKPLLAVFGIFAEFILAKSTYILVMGFLIDVYKIKNACVHRYLSFFTSIIDFRLQHVTYLLLLGKNSFAPKICFYSVDNTSLAWGLVAFRGLTHWCDIWWGLMAFRGSTHGCDIDAETYWPCQNKYFRKKSKSTKRVLKGAGITVFFSWHVYRGKFFCT